MEMTFSLQKSDIADTYKEIKRHIRKTPLEYSPFYSRLTGAEVFLKLENQQVTGSFKARGAVAKLMSLSDADYEKGVVAVSAGNHALGVAYALWRLKRKGLIILPENASKTKVNALKEFPVDLEFHGRDYDEAEQYTIKFVNDEDKTFVSPYNDPVVIKGQSTAAFEAFTEINDIDIMLVPVSGGGLLAGTLLCRNALGLDCRIYGVQSEASPAFKRSMEAGEIIEIPVEDSVADGLHGNVQPDSITFDVVMASNLEDILLVSEDEIKEQYYDYMTYQHNLIEGSAAVNLAALLRYKNIFEGKKVACLMTGANITPDLLKEMIEYRK
ncbi:MAG: threonine/serine dehydratase [bacterium]|nr:threonine/serine dehydratase [bacterium]